MFTRLSRNAGRLFLVMGSLLFLATGCGPKLEVTSNTTWDGAVGAADGGVSSVGPFTGNHTFDGADCGTFQKTTEGGTLSARVKYGNPLGPNGESASTSSAYGVVSVCGGD